MRFIPFIKKHIIICVMGIFAVSAIAVAFLYFSNEGTGTQKVTLGNDNSPVPSDEAVAERNMKPDADDAAGEKNNSSVGKKDLNVSYTNEAIEEHADRFEYEGRKYLYSELNFIQSKDYTYFILDKDEKEISITNIADAEGEVTIPGELDGYQVVCLGIPLSNYSAYEEGLYEPFSQYHVIEEKDIPAVTHISIPEGVQHIGIGAFMDMAHLRQVSLPDSLETIGVESFARSGIEELELPENLELIDLCAFYECDSLKRVTVNSSRIIGGGEYPSFKFCDYLEEVTWGDVDYADVDLFSLSTIKKVVIPPSVKTLEMVCCNIETLIIQGKDTAFITNKELGKSYWNDKFTILIPEGSAALDTIKGLEVEYIPK